MFFIAVSHGDADSQSDGSLQNNELITEPVIAELTSNDVKREDLTLFEESVKAAETHDVIYIFKQFKNPMVSNKVL